VGIAESLRNCKIEEIFQGESTQKINKSNILVISQRNQEDIK